MTILAEQVYLVRSLMYSPVSLVVVFAVAVSDGINPLNCQHNFFRLRQKVAPALLDSARQQAFALF